MATNLFNHWCSLGYSGHLAYPLAPTELQYKGTERGERQENSISNRAHISAGLLNLKPEPISIQEIF